VQRDDDAAEFGAVAVELVAAARHRSLERGHGGVSCLLAGVSLDVRRLGNRRSGIGSPAVERNPVLVIAAAFALIDFTLDVRQEAQKGVEQFVRGVLACVLGRNREIVSFENIAWRIVALDADDRGVDPLQFGGVGL